jgi:hypothetical protein
MREADSVDKRVGLVAVDVGEPSLETVEERLGVFLAGSYAVRDVDIVEVFDH